MLFFSTLLWGISFPVMKVLAGMNHLAAPGASPLFAPAYVAAPRYVIAAAVTLLVLLVSRVRPTRRELIQGLWVGLFSAGGTLSQTDGIQFTSASTSAFVTQMTCIFVPLWVALRTRHNPGLRTWLCCGTVLAGVGILGHMDLGTLRLGRGELETLLCAAFFSGQILAVDNKAYAGNRSGAVTAIMFAVQAVILAAFAVAVAPDTHALSAPWSSPTWVGLTLILAFVCSIGAFSIMMKYQPAITPTQAGLIYCAEPVFTSLLALFVPAWLSRVSGIAYSNEVPTLALIVGGGLITLANVTIQLPEKRD